MVAWTLITAGHSYGDSELVTSTGILDTSTGAVVGSLREFALVVEGRPYSSADVKVSNVTFADDNTFYASVFTAGHRYLVEGDIVARRLRTVADGVVSPSLSPDRTRIAFTHAMTVEQASHHGGGQLSIMDLSTLRITHVAEIRDVDDQAVWLDTGTVAYALQRPDGVNDVWAVPADGTGAPRLVVREANSPAPAG